MTQLGRGHIQQIEWYPAGDRIFVVTVTGAWIYTDDFALVGHLPDANRAVLSPDGQYIAGIDDAHHIRIWDADSLTEVEFSDGVSLRRVWALAWSSNGRYLAASGDKGIGIVTVWDTYNSFDAAQSVRSEGDSLLWSPLENSLMIYRRGSGWIIIMAVEPASFTTLMTWGNEVIWRDRDHILVLRSGENTDAEVWNIREATQVNSFTMLYPLAAYNHAADVLAYGQSRAVMLKDATTSERGLPVELGSECAWTTALDWHREDRWLAVGTGCIATPVEQNIYVVDVRLKTIVRSFDGLWDSVEFVQWHPDGRRLLAVDQRQQIVVYDVAHEARLASSDAHSLVGKTLAWRPDGGEMVIAGSDARISLVNVAEQRVIRAFYGHGAPVDELQWQPGGTHFVAHTYTNVLTYDRITGPVFTIWNTASPENDFLTAGSLIPSEGESQEPWIASFAWHPAGRILAIGSHDALILWEVMGSQTERIAFSDYLQADDQMIWSPTGRYLLLPNYEYTWQYLYDTKSEQFLQLGPSLVSGALRWSPEEEIVTLRWGGRGNPPSPNAIGTPLLRESPEEAMDPSVAIGERMMRFSGLLSNTVQGWLSPGTNYAAAIDGNHNGMIWDARTGEPLGMLSNVVNLAWAADETRLVVQRTDGSLWILESDGKIRDQLPISASVQSAVGEFFWSPDGRTLAHLHNGVIDLWRLDD